RYDFIVEHDVKELGAHTLVCTALYSDNDGERKYLPQYFKFMVANPLSVRTKVRVVKETTFLEASIENHTKSNLFMDQVDFEPAQHWSATVLRGVDHQPESKQPMSDVFKPPVLLRSGGGVHNFLYQLKLSSDGSSLPKVEGSNVLGKLQITWRTNLGEPGRLQPQQILGSPIARKDIELRAVEVPSIIMLEKPFVVRLNLANQTDRLLGPFEVWVSQSESLDEKAVMVNGLLTMHLAQVEAFSSSEFQLNLIAVKHGVQKITGITVFDTREKKTYDSLLELEVFIDSQ
uniref:Trafficking protein particle complex subunit 13-like n=1 Tax=Nicotiana tabacum TaxID=4097 RepID=A0A1S3ZVF2_TOBAC